MGKWTRMGSYGLRDLRELFWGRRKESNWSFVGFEAFLSWIGERVR